MEFSVKIFKMNLIFIAKTHWPIAESAADCVWCERAFNCRYFPKRKIPKRLKKGAQAAENRHIWSH